MLHGIGADNRSWTKLAPYLPDALDIYAIDLLGHGRSDAPAIDYDIMVQVKVLEEFIEKLKLKGPVAFGHSYGGWVALHYAQRNQPGDLIVEDVAGLQWQLDSMDKMEGHETYAKDLIDGAVKIGGKLDVIKSIIGNMANNTLTADQLSKIKSKTLIFWGSDDNMVQPEFGVQLNRTINGSELCMIEKAGHVPHRSVPKEVADRVIKFLG